MEINEIRDNLSIGQLKELMESTLEILKSLIQKELPEIRNQAGIYCWELSSKLSVLNISDVFPTERYKREYRTEVLTLLENIDVFLRKTSYDLRQNTEMPTAQMALFGAEKAAEITYHTLDFPVEEIQAEFTGDRIFIRTPMLRTRSSLAQDCRKAPTYLNSFYGKSVARALENSRTKGRFPLPRSGEKVDVFYLFVYASDRVRSWARNTIADNDNHATKDVTDAICHTLFPFGDDPACVWFRYGGCLSEKVPEGTYITVSLHENNPVTETEVLNFWQTEIGKNKKEDAKISADETVKYL